MNRLVCALALLIASFCHGVASDSGYRHLELRGHKVRWHPGQRGEIVLRYHLVGQRLNFGAADNCPDVRPVDGIEAGAGLAAGTLRRELEGAFSLWSEVAPLRFEEATDPEIADILIGAQGVPQGRAFAQVFFDAAAAGVIKPITRAVVCLNSRVQWKVGYDGNLSIYDLKYTLAHEIGHAIGLDHPSGAGQLMWFRYEEKFRSLRSGDIAGVQALYGTRSARVTGAN